MNAGVIISSEKHWAEDLPHVSVDCVVFGFYQNKLQVLLLNMGDAAWFLPGGYVGKEESVDKAAERVLFERSGAEKIFLSSFAIFGNTNRSEGYFIDYPDNLWHKQRFISIGYYALIDHSSVTPKPDEYSEKVEWKPVSELPEMVMDHGQIISKALETLREQINYRPIGYNLLPDEFTMPELQALYEAVLGKTLNRGNFYRKIMRLDILDQLDEPRKGGAHKAPNLYRFNKEKYDNALGGFNW